MLLSLPLSYGVTEWVVSSPLETSGGQNSVFLRSVEEIKALKNTKGSEIQVDGSGELVQTLLRHDLLCALCI